MFILCFNCNILFLPFVKLVPMFKLKIKFTERTIILYTAVLVLLAGVVRYFFHYVGGIIFYFAFAPYLVYRVYTIFRYRKQPTTQLGVYRVLVLVFMAITIVFNALGWQKADFLLVFLLMVDYLLVMNGRF